jgi:electron-transferring-flavoprotein dehydrogenase
MLAAVYELIDDVEAEGGRSMLIQHENCVPCKTCDIADPLPADQLDYAGRRGGPDYTRM